MARHAREHAGGWFDHEPVHVAVGVHGLAEIGFATTFDLAAFRPYADRAGPDRDSRVGERFRDLAGRADLRIVVAQCLQPPEFDRAHAILPSAYGACRPLVAAACGEHGGA